jgi:hypothetical protein
MFRIILDIVLFATFIGGFCMGVKTFLIKFSIRTRNGRLVGRNWNGSVSNNWLKKLRGVTSDELLIKEIDKALYFHKVVIIILIIGFSSFVALVILNGFFRWD